jgi:hypothetical protein
MAERGVGSQIGVEVVYRSLVRVEAKPGGIKLVSLPAEPAPVPMGMHGAIAKHYKLAEGSFTPHASTLDYVVGATAGCLAGTLGRALTMRKIPVGEGRLQVEAVGELEADDSVLVIRRIRVVAQLKADASNREATEQITEDMSRTDKGLAESEKTQGEFSNYPSPEEIRQRAYELHVESGCVHGRDLDDWLQAEQDLPKK